MGLLFPQFFARATNQEPFPYQIAFAAGNKFPALVHAPTGAGKTATAILGWLWRFFHSGRPTPRRLAYCLPMRVLVEQTRDEARKWIEALGLPVTIHTLLGGEDTDPWDLDPNKPAILIGTQDMLLSRALNRGYGMSRFRWPMHFGLLNNDCLWVLDEIQLMGVGLATSAQLQAFRERFPTYGEVPTVWMSATLLPQWLATVDYRHQVTGLTTLRLTETDYSAPGLQERWEAPKQLSPSGQTADNTATIAQFVRAKHQRGSLTLVVVNRVERSRTLFEALRTLYQPGQPRGRGKKPSPASESAGPPPDLRLIHSRFRPMEREGWMKWLKEAPPSEEGRIVISTQVVEAGVDVSARTLVTELAPWPSLVQRFGRCNRKGEFKKSDPGRLYWIDVPAEDDKQAAPYSKKELDAARERLESLNDAGLKTLHEFFVGLSDRDRLSLFPYDPPHVLRRKDFLDLFDTTPDLAGNDVDVSRFIREGEDLDVQMFWRAGPPPTGHLGAREARQLAPSRRELCPVPVRAFREFVSQGKKTAFRWDALNGVWAKVASEAIFPGQVFWIPRDQGGYSREFGWDPKAALADTLELLTPRDETVSSAEDPEYDSDLLSVFGWRSIAEHTEDVLGEIDGLAGSAPPGGVPWDVLRVAAHWHDWGKAHAVFQAAIRDEAEGDKRRPENRVGSRDIAKAVPPAFWRPYSRRHFRHELASALGVLTLLHRGPMPSDWGELTPLLQNLALYLIAAHHGKVRLSIRSLPDESKPPGPETLFARGVWDGDELPAVKLGQDVSAPAVVLDLSPMQLGRGEDGSPSWAERMVALRDQPDIGPFRLAYLEALLRAGDMRASKKADEKAKVKSE